jgi:Ca2+-binding RTX toxin-like protein
METNDTINQAIDTGLVAGTAGTFNTFDFIGDNPDIPDNIDVDLYKVQLKAGDRLGVDIDAQTFGSTLDTVLRLFDASGNELAISLDTSTNDTFSTDSLLDFAAKSDGTYYIGVSGNDNVDYDPEVEGSGSNSGFSSGATGDYSLNITVAPPITLTGTGRDDFLAGGEGNDSLTGLGGDDDLIGQGGNDTLKGGTGDDLINAGAGNDSVEGGIGDDEISGAAGNDTLKGGDGLDVMTGGDGDDRMEGGKGKDRISGESGNDNLSGGDDNDNLNGGNGFDTLNGGKGNDNLFGGNDFADDTLNGDDGNDRLNGGDGFDSLNGGNGNDNLFGGNDFDNLSGGGGNDTISGGNDFSGDSLFGDDGADRLIGGNGFDDLNGGAGRDTLIGVSTTSGFGAGEIDILTGGAGQDTFILGDSSRVYYNDGDPNSRGQFDYAQIIDFNASQDVIQLKGSASAYRLDFFGASNALIVLKPEGVGRAEVIGQLDNVSDTLSLTSSSFTYV